MSGRKWTDEETAFLERQWVNMDPEDIAEKLGRTKIAVLSKARLYGLGRRVDGGGEMLTVGMINRAFGKSTVAHITVSLMERSGLKVRRFPLRNVTRYSVRIDEFWPWIRTHQDMWPVCRLEPMALGQEPEWVDEMRRQERRDPTHRKKKLWTDAEDARLVLMARSRKTLKEISAALCRTENAILLRASILGTDMRYAKERRRRPWTDAEMETVVRMVRSGSNAMAIGRALDRSERMVKIKLMRRFGTSSADRIRRTMSGGDAHHGRRRKQGA